VGYPKLWRDYSSLEISRTGYLKNVHEATTLSFDDLRKRETYALGIILSSNLYFKPKERSRGNLHPPFVSPASCILLNMPERMAHQRDDISLCIDLERIHSRPSELSCSSSHHLLCAEHPSCFRAGSKEETREALPRNRTPRATPIAVGETVSSDRKSGNSRPTCCSRDKSPSLTMSALSSTMRPTSACNPRRAPYFTMCTTLKQKCPLL